jgi:hypothetical protein
MIAGEQLIEIPEGYPYRPHVIEEEEFDQLKKNPALFLRMYENAKKFIEAWQQDLPPPIEEDVVQDSIAAQQGI